jgi:hypothetical protein
MPLTQDSGPFANLSMRHLTMPLGQAVDLLVGRGQRGVALLATYLGDTVGEAGSAPRALTDSERAAVIAASRRVADAIAGDAPQDEELERAIDLLRALAIEVEGRPTFRLADGRIVAGEGLAMRARLDAARPVPEMSARRV